MPHANNLSTWVAEAGGLQASARITCIAGTSLNVELPEDQ